MKFIHILLFYFTSICFLSSLEGQKKSLYSSIFEIDGLINVNINTNLGHLVRKSSKEEYQQAEITIYDESSSELIALPGRIRARGNMRKKQCRYPPIKIDFKKSDLDSLGYKKKIDKLKMVFPCRGGNGNQEKLYKEYLLYDIYKIIDPKGLNAKLSNVTFIEEDGKETQFTGMFVEEEKAYKRRTDAKIIESGNLRAPSLDRDLYLKMSFFQFMIANTDYSVANKHNLEMVKHPDNRRVVAIPYDFDYSGFVGQHYAVPHESLPIEDVNERYFFVKDLTIAEFNKMVTYFLSIEDQVNNTIESASYMDDKNRKMSKHYLKSFFDMLRKPKVLRRQIIE